MLVDLARDLFLAHYAHQALSFLPVFEQNDCRYPSDSVTLCRGWIVIDIQLHDASTRPMLLGYRLERGRKRSARPAPGSPEVNQHWHFRLQNNSLKILVVYSLTCSPMVISL